MLLDAPVLRILRSRRSTPSASCWPTRERCLDWIPDMNLIRSGAQLANHMRWRVTDAQIDDMLINNPKALFDHADAY